VTNMRLADAFGEITTDQVGPITASWSISASRRATDIAVALKDALDKIKAISEEESWSLIESHGRLAEGQRGGPRARFIILMMMEISARRRRACVVGRFGLQHRGALKFQPSRSRIPDR